MKLFAYVVAHDTGFAPNPYHGYYTLATCKPKIRVRAKPGDWVVGVGSVRTAGRDRCVYAMEVSEVVSFERYGRESRFRAKQPVTGSNPYRACGDNIYEWRERGWFQRPSPHWRPRGKMLHDLAGQNVLLSTRFYYFGGNAPKMPEKYRDLIPRGRADRNRFPEEFIAGFVRWLGQNFVLGVHGEPWHLALAARPVSTTRKAAPRSSRPALVRCAPARWPGPSPPRSEA